VELKDRLARDRTKKLVPIKEKANKLLGMYLLLEALPFVPKEKLVKLDLAQNHFFQRAALPDNRLLRVPQVVRNVVRGHYSFSSKDWWLPAFGDLLE
jgi:hypothetical protein